MLLSVSWNLKTVTDYKRILILGHYKVQYQISWLRHEVGPLAPPGGKCDL
jgi:hypothetical protein